MQGGLGIYDVASGNLKLRISTPGFPFGVVAITKGAAKDKKIYVSSERDGVVGSYDPETGKSYRLIATGSQPTMMYLSPDQSRLFVANASSDTVSIIDTSSDRVLKTALLRPPALRGLPGVSPLGMCLTPNGKKLLVALSDMNCIAQVNPVSGSVDGYVPTGWLPTAIACDPDGSAVIVTSAKGVKTRNPNGKPVGNLGQYIQDVIVGTVSRIPMTEFSKLEKHTATVAVNNRIVPNLNSATHPDFKNPGIKYVIYIVKENRTYDQVLGDIPRGVRDPALCLFPRAVTPNQHAIVDRFVQFDNFYVCAEVSADGWNWSTSGMANPYTSRNTTYNYSGRGRNYDFEGGNNGIPVDLLGFKDVARAPGGYLWENAIKHNVSFRNYGMFLTFDDPGDKRNTPGAIDQKPAKKALVGSTCLDFRRYDLSYADSEAYLRHSAFFPIQMKEFGPFKAPSRFTVWKREFDEFVQKGTMPRLQLVRMGTDHTSGTRVGSASPRAMVADNDYAVGQIVEAVSKSPFWKQTAIFILEDDAQAGYDSVDAHRSTCYVVSPFVKKNLLDSKFYNTDSVLRTMELILGMKPMNQFDAVARPMAIFSAAPENNKPFDAILPDREVIADHNKATAFGAKKSEKLFPRYIADPGFDEEQTEIVWRAVTGKPVPKRFR
jgi:YVTN family beta-propeller protein